MRPSHLSTLLSHLIDQKVPVFIWGAPGIGKSSIVRQIADLKRLEFLDLRLSLLDPTDLKGIPFFDPQKREGVWAKPSFLPSDPDSRGILFLDEINTAPPAVQASAYQLILDRKIGEYALPESWSIVAAGNRENDRGVVYRMPPPLANRFVHFEMEVDFEDWKRWAYDAGIHPAVIAFLRFDPQKLFAFDPQSERKSFPTPRSWSYVDTILKSDIPETMLLESVEAAVGQEAAVAFLSFLKVMERLPDPLSILEGETTEVQTQEHSVLIALVTGIVNALKRESSPERIDHVLRFSMQLPGEFAVMLLQDMQQNSITVEESPLWPQWVARFSYLLS